ncbi:MAG: hypothetical protein M3063_15840 [Actinomycetota bacterium]|nr:hypothetical protein [Actinomycetota bacterium]
MIAAFRRRGRLGQRRGVARPPRPSKVGEAAPELTGVTPANQPLRIQTGPGTHLVVAFLTSSCLPCSTFWTALAADPGGAEGVASGPAMVVVTPDPSTENRQAVQRLAPASVPVIMSSQAWIDCGVSGSPFFVVVADGLIVAEGVAHGWAELLRLIPAG